MKDVKKWARLKQEIVMYHIYIITRSNWITFFIAEKIQIKFVIIKLQWSGVRSNYTFRIYACDLCDKPGTTRTTRTKTALQSDRYTLGHVKKQGLLEARNKAEKTFGKCVLCPVCRTNSFI